MEVEEDAEHWVREKEQARGLHGNDEVLEILVHRLEWFLAATPFLERTRAM